MFKKCVLLLLLLSLIGCGTIEITGGNPAPTPDIVRYRITIDGFEYRCKGYTLYDSSAGTHIDLTDCEGYFGKDLCIKDFVSAEVVDVRE